MNTCAFTAYAKSGGLKHKLFKEGVVEERLSMSLVFIEKLPGRIESICRSIRPGLSVVVCYLIEA